MKSIFSSRRNKSPHNNEEAEKQDAPFFAKENKTPFFNTSNGGVVQTKLTVGQPGDKYEKEADSMADAVVNKSSSKPAIQNKEISSIQRESLATPQEDEKLGTAEQRMEEDKLVQEKPEVQKMGGEEEEEGMVSKMEGEEEKEGMVNKLEGEEEEEGMISKMEGAEEEEETLQTKSNGSKATASPGLTQQIKGTSGKGKAMSKNTRAEMEASFGRDFSGVNIHTDQDAVKMNKELGAQAFTHGKDVYFNSGKYNPDSSDGKRLLAHELTHVIQQTKDIQPKIQAYRVPSNLPCNGVVPWLDTNSPFLPGWAQTSSDFSFNGNLNISAPETTEGGLIRLTVTGHEGLTVSVATTIAKPSWGPSPRTNREADVAAWNNMMTVLSAHEQEHRVIGEGWRTVMQERFRAINFSVEAESRAGAIAQIREQLSSQQGSWIAEAQAAQDAIDPFNGATLTCPATTPVPAP
jgi:hypothetical protein